MPAASTKDGTSQIGETAGLVWKMLDQDGPTTVAKLAGAVDAPRDVVMQAVGWLAREEKIHIEQGPRSRVISLRK